MKRLALVAAVVLTAAPAHAYRPFDSTDADIAEYGELELEVGPVGYLREDHRSHFTPLEVLNLGFLPRWELVLQGTEELPPERPDGPAGIGLGDTGAFLKTVLRRGCLQGAGGPSVATEVGALLPTLHDDPGAGFSVDVIVSQRWSFGTLHLNAQGARSRAGNPDGFAGLIAEGPYAWTARPVAELFVDRELGAHTTLSALAGLIVRASDRFALDAGLRYATLDGAALVEARMGFTWTIAVWKGRDR